MIFILRAILGILAFILLSYLISENKKNINWKLVINGIIFQIVIAVLILKVPIINDFFSFIASIFEKAYQVSLEGSSFIFGDDLVKNNKLGFIFAFRILPTIIFFSAISSLLYYLKILPYIVGLFSKVMQKFLKISGAESLSVAANIFLGHTEAPLIVKPYIEKMTRSELNTLITGGFATITGAVLAALIGIMGGDDPVLRTFYAKHFLVASIISAPAAVIISKIIVPETNNISLKQEALIEGDKSKNIFDALANGTFDGLKLSLNVAAMIIVFLSLIALINIFLSDIVGSNIGINKNISYADGFTLQYIFGLVASPFAGLMGINWNDAILCGQLIGEKTVFNEFVAYSTLKDMILNQSLTDERSIIIISYGLCGFANFGSIGIMIGAIATLAPSRKSETAFLSLKALIGGSFACFITACIAGVLI